MRAADSLSGNARVSRAGDGVAPSRTFIENQSNDGARYCRRRLPHFENAWAIFAVTIATKNAGYLSPETRTIVLNVFIFTIDGTNHSIKIRKRNFTTLYVIPGIQVWQGRIRIIRGSGRRMMMRAIKDCFGGTPKPARVTRALPRHSNHD